MLYLYDIRSVPKVPNPLNSMKNHTKVIVLSDILHDNISDSEEDSIKHKNHLKTFK